MMRINELMLEYRKEVIRECGSLYGFNVEEALLRMNCLSVVNPADKELVKDVVKDVVVKEKKARKPKEKKVKTQDDGVNIVNKEEKVDSVSVELNNIKIEEAKVEAKVEAKEEAKVEAKVKKERKKREPKEKKEGESVVSEEKKKGRPKSDKPKEKKESKKGRPKKETKEISSEGDLDDLFANLVKKSEENNSETSSITTVNSNNDSVKTRILVEEEVKVVVEEVKKEEIDVVKKFEFQGTKYLKSTKSGIIYNMEQEIVGTWNDKTETIDFHEEEEEEEDEYDEDE